MRVSLCTGLLLWAACGGGGAGVDSGSGTDVTTATTTAGTTTLGTTTPGTTTVGTTTVGTTTAGTTTVGTTTGVPPGCEPADPESGPMWAGCIEASPIAEGAFAAAAADALCALYLDCGCETIYGTYGDLPGCVAAITAKVGAWQTEAQGAGLVYDADAAGGAIAGWAARGCELTANLDQSFCQCRFYEGTQGAGAQDCETVALGSTCQGDVTCYGPVEGMDFAECSGACAGGMAVGVGMDCSGGQTCFEPGQELYCAENGLCAPIPAVGENCTPNGKCSDDAFCPGGEGCEKLQTCTDLPSIGEPCGDKWPGGGVIDIYGMCEPDATCEYVGDTPTCVAKDPLPAADGTPCQDHSECAGSCINQVCGTPARVCSFAYFN